MAGVPPIHPSLAGQPVFQTPPQAGVERHTTPENIRRFFDPTTYRTNSGIPKISTSDVSNLNWERHTTPENIRRFFDPQTYKTNKEGVEPSPAIPACQKRPAPEAVAAVGGGAPPVAKAKTMAKNDLVEKFKLAAKLNGVDWDDIAVSCVRTNQEGYCFVIFRFVFITV